MDIRLFEVPLSQQIKGLHDDLYDVGFSRSVHLSPDPLLMQPNCGPGISLRASSSRAYSLLMSRLCPALPARQGVDTAVLAALPIEESKAPAVGR